MNNKQILLLVVVLVGITIWNIPNTTSLFYNQHSFYNNSAPCQKCHQDIQNILELPETPEEHYNLECRGCHTRDGNTSHAASRITCNSCHQNEVEHANNYSCITCHGSHASVDPENHRSLNIICIDCHRFR